MVQNDNLFGLSYVSTREKLKALRLPSDEENHCLTLSVVSGILVAGYVSRDTTVLSYAFQVLSIQGYFFRVSVV